MSTQVDDLVKFAEQKRDSYKRDATFHQRAFFISEIMAVILLGSTPILINLSQFKENQWPATLTSVSGIVAGLSTKYKWRKSWIQCQKTSEAIDYEIELFQIQKDADEANEKLFIDKIREIEFNHIKNWEKDTDEDGLNPDGQNPNHLTS
jgi:hypothetical protein